MKKIILLVFTIVIFISCQPSKQSVQAETEALVQLMTGSFSSSKQARKDSAFYDISLKMYPIWPEKKGENWLYVEQAVSSAPDRPYRQRVYKVERLSKDSYESQVFTLPQPKRFIGKWQSPDYFSRITPDSLILRNGCSVYLRKVSKDYYRGATKEGTCESTLRSAAYATSEVEIFEDKIISWDRGFDKDGNQVWGAEKGGYIFNRE